LSNTSNSKINKANNPTTKKNNDQTVRVIVGEIGRDTKTGILGRGYSPDNGSTFHVTDTMFGRLYDQKDIDAIWNNGTGHKVKDEIDKQLEGMGDAKSAADSAVKFAESAVAASKVNSDAIVAQSEAISEAKAAADSAAAEIQQTKANAASDVAAIKQDVADMQTEINTAKSANEEAVKSAQADVAKAQSEVDQVKDSLAKVSGDLDTYANSAAEQGHDITVIKQKQGQFEADYASVNGKVNQLQADTDGLRENIKNNQGNIASLQTSASQASIELENAKSQVAKLQLTADGYERTFADQDGRLSKVEQTTTEHTTEIADAKGNLSKISQKVDELAGTFTNAEKDINNIKLDAKGLHDTLTGQGNQLASLNVTLNSLDSKYSGITGDLQSKQTALSTEQQQTKDMLLNKADKSEVDSVKGTVNQVSAEQKLMADQINQKVSSAEYQTLKGKVDSMKIGTRNLLHGTSDQYRSLTGAGWMEVHTSSDMYTSVANYHMGDWFTYAATINNTSDVPVELQVWRCDQNKNRLSNGMLGISAYVQPGQSNVRVFLTGQIDANTWYLQTAVYSSGGQNGQHTIQVKDERLVEGNVTGSWESNPTDTITAIQKNSTAIDETNKLVSIKADKTEVNNLNNTAQQLSARLNVMAGEVKSKVDETRVNNLIDGRGFATQSTVQSLIDQRAGTLSESITNLTTELENSGGGVNLQTGTEDCSFGIGLNGNSATIEKYDEHTKMVHSQNGGFYTAYNAHAFVPTPGETYTISADIKGDGTLSGGTFKYEGGDNGNLGTVTITNQWQRISNTVHVNSVQGQWIIYPSGSTNLYVKHLKIERGRIATPYSQAPSDNATVTQLQSVTASIDGLQSNVTNFQNNTKSQFTQLSNIMQSKISSADFNALKQRVDMQTLDSADINNMKTSGHYFVRNLANSPISGWVYVDVTGNDNDRIRQDVYQDGGNQHKYRRWFGSYWTGWDEGATYTEINQLQNDINLRVVKGQLMSQINMEAGRTLIQSNKLYLDADSVVFSGKAFIPSAAIASLAADKVNTGWLNTNNVSLGDGRTRIRADHDYLYIQPTGSASSNTGIRMSYTGLDFLTNVIPNGYNSPVPYYSIGYDGASNGYLRISAFDHLNPGGATATQNWFAMTDAISLNNQEINFASKGNMRMQVNNGGVNIRSTLFLQNNTNNGTWVGFNRLDNSNTVEFNTGDNNGENFHVNSGARFMQYVYINGYAKAQGWLTNSTLSKKTNITKLDAQVALSKIRQDDQYLYEYKRNVAQGIYDPQASFIIDDVHDVAQYSVPREFIDQSGKYREPNVELAYLIAAFQELDRQVQAQQTEIKKLKENN